MVASVWEGHEAVAAVRSLCGVTDPIRSAAGTIRGDLGLHWRRNVVHSSDSVDSASREIGSARLATHMAPVAGLTGAF